MARARLELAHPKILDFESSASTIPPPGQAFNLFKTLNIVKVLRLQVEKFKCVRRREPEKVRVDVFH